MPGLPKELQTELDSLKAEAIGVATKASAKAEDIQKAVDKIRTEFDAAVLRIETALKAKGILSMPGCEGDSKKTFSFTKAMRLQTFGANSDYCKDCGYELEVMNASAKMSVEKAGQFASSGIAGGFFIPVEVSDMVIPLAHSKMPIMDLKPTLLKNLTSNLTIPRVTARSVGYWIGENAVPGPAGVATQSSNTFGMINLTPKRLAVYNKISNLLLLQAPSVAEKTILEELALMIALEWHKALLYGTGTSYQPKGILKSGISSSTAIGAAGGRFTFDCAQRMEADIDKVDLLLDTGNFAFVVHPNIKQGLKRERVGFSSGTSAVANEGFPMFGMFQGMMDNKAVEDRVGYAIKSTTQIHTNNVKGNSSTMSDVLFGDFTQLIIATWADMVLKKTDVASDPTSSAFLNDETWFLMQMQCDTAIKNELAFTKLTDAESNPANW